MALYIKTDVTQESIHVGNMFPLNRINYVEEIQADGHELEWILSNVSGIPLPLKTVSIVRWYGDDAKFITYLFGRS